MDHYQGKDFAQRIFQVHTPESFNALCLEIFLFQYQYNVVYRRYCDLIGRKPDSVLTIEQIPFLPVEFYKTHRITSVTGKEALVFHSSGTTGDTPSSHAVYDPALYEQSILRSFSLFYGAPENYCFVALLPSPEEKPDSSLAYMADLLIKKSGCAQSGFYLGNEQTLKDLNKKNPGKKIFVLGLSFALADLAEQYPGIIHPDIVMETGGMKGHRKEITREELHALISQGLGVEHVHSEYSMCELFSQAYSSHKGVYHCPPWMKVLLRDPYDPLAVLPGLQKGGINIIDLANIHTCSFVATQDLGTLAPDGSFTVLGRFDHSALRGCSLMLE